MIIFQNNLQRMFNKKSSWVYLLGVPILLNLFIVVLSMQQAQWVIGVKDDDSSAVTKHFVKVFGESGKIVPVEDPATVPDSLKGSVYDLYIEFPKGYMQSVIDGKQPSLDVMDRSDNNQTDALKVELRSFLGVMNALGVASQGDATSFEKAFGEYTSQKFTAKYLTFDGGDTADAARTVLTLGYLGFGIMLMMTSAGSLLLEDRLRGVFDRAQLTPMKPHNYFSQYLLSMLVIGLVQLTVVLAVIPLMTPITYGSSLRQVGGIVLAAALFTLFCVSMSMLIHRFARTALSAAAIASAIDLPLLMLGGALWPRDIMPETLQSAGRFSPVWWYLDAAEFSLRGDSWQSIAQPLGLLLGLSLLLVVLVFTIRTERTK